MPAEAGVVEGSAEESDETHTLWISRGDGSNGGNRKKVRVDMDVGSLSVRVVEPLVLAVLLLSLSN